MPAKRLPWVRLWVESLEHEKVALLSDAEYRTWTMLLLRGSQQPTRWRFASVRHAALVVGRPVTHVKALAARHLLELQEDGAVWVHDAAYWQSSAPGRPASHIWRALCRAVFARDDYTCRRCGERGKRLECDHIIPIARGGSSDMANLQTLCRRCNRKKWAHL